MLRINEQKATEVAKRIIREWRVKEFQKNDIAIQTALADGDEQGRIKAVTRRNWLRDLPQQCEGKTVEELKDILSGLGDS